MLPLLALHCGDYPFWCSASSSCLLGWKRGQCRLAKSVAACHLCVSRLCLLFFFFFSTSSTSSAVSPLSLSQSNYWNSCINCQHLPTWPCQWGGNSALSWFSLWSNAPAPSFSTMERRCVMVYIHEHISPLLWLVLPLILSLSLCVSLWEPVDLFFFYLMFFFCSIKPERQTTLITRPLGNKSRHYLFSLSGEDTARDSMKAICLVVAMMLPNNKEQTLPWRPDHFSKCLVRENSRVIEHITAVGVKDANLFRNSWKHSYFYCCSKE